MENKRRKLVGTRFKMNRCMGGLFSIMNEDILREVLSRISIRDFRRAECVCKGWLSVISSPEFIEIHSHRKHEPSLGLLIATEDREARELVFYYSSLLDEQQREQYDRPCPVFVPRLRFSNLEYQWMTQVVNGLVCLYSRNRLSLLNICTREILDLPLPPSHRPDQLHYSIQKFRVIHAVGSNSRGFTLGPPPPTSATNCIKTHYHLGFDPVHKVYKVLCLIHMGDEDCSRSGYFKCPCDVLMVQILTLSGPVSSYKWRGVKTAQPFSAKHHTVSFCANGIWYWMYEHHPIILSDGYTPACFSGFSHVVHEYSWPPVPCQLFPNYNSRELELLKFSEFCGSFAVVDCFSSKGILHFYTHRHRQGEQNWEKDTVELPDVLISPRCDYDITPVGNLPKGDVLLANANESFSTPLVCSYNHDAKSFKLFQVGKFPPFVVSMSPSEFAVRVACVEENLTPLHHLLGTQDVVSG